MLRVWTALLGLNYLTAARIAAAQPPERLLLESSGSCPSAAQVGEELGPLLPHTHVETALDPAAPPPRVVAHIEDEDSAVRVRVDHQERAFRDPERACRERARTAAVFIGLVLDPPILPEVKPASPPPPPPPPPPPLPRPAARPPGTPLTLELGPLLEAAPISDAAQLPLAGGFGGRLVWGRAWGIAVGAAFLLPTRLALPAADARLVWLPFDLSLRKTYETDVISLAGELGPEAALLFVTGDRVKNPRTSTRLEVGARAALSLTWSMSQHLGAFLTLFGVYRPRPYEFKVNPDLESGSTPPLWLGASLGLSFRTR
ncbi:MAG TPA: hypothetical protein VHB79_30105 [Polyangiaceae bacterium]|nr:hypothetical protein [Polyangiaceae bacterium]